MDDKPEISSQAPPDLAAAIRQARLENAERAEAIADLRELEIARLSALESALKPVVEQAPPGVDMFDLALTSGERPRLFLDMIAFIDMGHDRRTYRFYQDTRNGRMLIAESQSVDRIAAAAAGYVARRLVERERALAASGREAEAPEAEGRRHRAWPLPSPPSREPHGRSIDEAAAHEAAEPWPPPRRFARRLGDALGLFLMSLGAITLALLIGLGAYLAWTLRLRDLWSHWIGAAPF